MLTKTQGKEAETNFVCLNSALQQAGSSNTTSRGLEFHTRTLYGLSIRISVLGRECDNQFVQPPRETQAVGPDLLCGNPENCAYVSPPSRTWVQPPIFMEPPLHAAHCPRCPYTDDHIRSLTFVHIR